MNDKPSTVAKPAAAPEGKPATHNRVITVRLPEDLHASLVIAAHDARLSLNQYCVQALRDRAAPPPADIGPGVPSVQP